MITQTIDAPPAATVLARVASAADDTQSPTPGPDAEPETPDAADGPSVGALVDGLSR